MRTAAAATTAATRRAAGRRRSRGRRVGRSPLSRGVRPRAAPVRTASGSSAKWDGSTSTSSRSGRTPAASSRLKANDSVIGPAACRPKLKATTGRPVVAASRCSNAWAWKPRLVRELPSMTTRIGAARRRRSAVAGGRVCRRRRGREVVGAKGDEGGRDRGGDRQAQTEEDRTRAFFARGRLRLRRKPRAAHHSCPLPLKRGCGRIKQPPVQGAGEAVLIRVMRPAQNWK